MKLQRSLFIPFTILLLVGLASCSTSNRLTYFKDLATVTDSITTMPAGDYSLKIEPDDELMITVTSLAPEATAMYNLPMANVATRGIREATGNVSLQTYIVNSKGDINFPMLGTLHVAGLTTQQLTDLLVKRISADVETPIVRVEIVNFAINVLGEVNAPGRQGINRESFTILDAIAKAGDLSPYGKRENILLMRREGDKTIYHRFDLTDASTFNTPYFFLKQNDVVYVEPNKIRSDNSKYNTNNSFKIQVISTVLSTVSVISSLIIALTR